MASASQKGSLASWALAPLGGLYACIIQARNRYYDRAHHAVRRAPLPVISVGNITTGGTGKTPVVIEVVRLLREMGQRPAILTRGYAARAGQQADEVREFNESLPDVPVIVNTDRYAGAVEAKQRHDANAAVMDDGFQHRRLHRNLDIVLIDGLNPWGGGRMLPAGRLREPRNSLRRADWILITRANQAGPEAVNAITQQLQKFAPETPTATADVVSDGISTLAGAGPACEDLAGMRVLPVCAIGNPNTFLRLLASLEAHVCEPLIYPDHHHYTQADLNRITAAGALCGAAFIVTTRKDWVKLAPLASAGSASAALARMDIRVRLNDDEGRLRAGIRRVLE